MSDENDKCVEPIVVEDLGIAVEVQEEGLNAKESNNSDIKAMIDEQNREAEEFAIAFLKNVVRLRGVRVDRAQFLRRNFISEVSALPRSTGRSRTILQ